MLQKSLLTLVLAFSFSLTAQATEDTKGEVTTQAQETPATAPKFTTTYAYYHYDLQGKTTATTGIYEFNKGTVDLQLLTMTYAYSANWTLMAFVPYIKNTIQTVYYPTLAPTQLEDKIEGLSDIRLMGMSPLWIDQSSMAFYDLSLSLPTGSIEKTFPTNPTQKASYNMQLGSGTTDFIAGFTYMKPTATQLMSTFRSEVTLRPGKNSQGYNLGNELKLKADSKYTFNQYFTAGVEANYKGRTAVVGRLSEYEIFNQDAVYGKDGHQYYHGFQAQWDTSLVAKATLPVTGTVKASLEAGLPFYQDQQNKDDVKLFTENWVSASVTGAF